jgi:hypothetical protein
MVLKYNLDSTDVEAVDTSSRSLTSVTKLTRLFDDGHQLEASAAQAFLVEAMVMHYLLSRVQADHVSFSQDPQTLLLARRLTFGKMVRLLGEPGGLHDATLLKELDRYVGLRNSLAHHLMGRAFTINFDEFFGLGQQLISRLTFYMHDLIRRHA